MTEISCLGNTYIHVLHYSNMVGAWTIPAPGWAQVHYPNWLRSSGADLDSVEYQVYLPAGTYTVQIMTLHLTGRGIMDVDLDGVEIGSFDCFASAFAGNQVKTISGVVVAAGGIKTLKIRADGKNPLSGAYYLDLSDIQISRTA